MSRPAVGGGSPESIDLYPNDLDSVAGKFATGQSRLDTIATTLNTALQNAAGMAGNDSYGHKFGAKYDPAAKTLFHTLSAAVRAVGQASSALVTTANNYLKADHHSNPKHGKSTPVLYPPPPVFTDVMYPDPDSPIGAGSSSMPSVLAKYWPNGHQDRLRDAATAYRTASTALLTLGHSLHQQVLALTDNNSDDSVHAMAAFWAKVWQDGAGAKNAPLSAAREACDKLAAACDKFAHAIDEAHSSTEHRLAGAGIAIGLTSAAGILLTVFTGGGSDVGAAALDGAEATAILGGVEVTLDAAVTDISADMIADIETYLQAAADGVPEIETVDAETTEVSQTLDRELAETEGREPAGVGGRGRSGGGGRGGSGGDEPPPAEEPAPLSEEEEQAFSRRKAELAKLSRNKQIAEVRKGIEMDGQKYKPEGALLRGSKHGIDWTEGPQRVAQTGNPQGQFGSPADVEFAAQKGAELGPGKEGFFRLPRGNDCVEYMTDGTIRKPNSIFVKVRPNGTIHAYPLTR